MGSVGYFDILVDFIAGRIYLPNRGGVRHNGRSSAPATRVVRKNSKVYLNFLQI